MKTSDINHMIGNQRGFTLIELLVALAISIVVMSGVVQVLTVSKSNFVTGRELAMSQENARYAMKFISDEIRMGGFTGCSSRPYAIANSIKGAGSSWYLNNPGIQGFENAEGVASFPPEFSADVIANTDAFVVRRAVPMGVRIKNHVKTSANISPTKPIGSNIRGRVMLIASPDCYQVGVFQATGPNNANPNVIVHDTGNAVSPGNCSSGLAGQNTRCDPVNNLIEDKYPDGSSVYELRSAAFYVGSSNGVPALYRERMLLDTSTYTLYTAAEELVRGVENMQLSYGIDTQPAPPEPRDGLADKYVNADHVDLDNPDNLIVSIRLSLRMRSQLPVYLEPEPYGMFEGVAGTDGADRFMHQDISTTVTVRNF